MNRQGAAERRSILHYELLEEVGQGGMGVVYRAHDKALESEPQERHRCEDHTVHQLSDQSGQALLGGETVRLDEDGGDPAEGVAARPGQAMVVVHLHGGGVQSLADSEIAGGGALKTSPMAL